MCRNTAPWLGRRPNLINNAEQRSLQKKAIILCRVTSKKKLAEDSNYRLLCSSYIQLASTSTMQDLMLHDRCCDENAVFLSISAKATIWVSKATNQNTRNSKNRQKSKTQQSRLGHVTNWGFQMFACWNFASFAEARFVLASCQIPPSLLGQYFTVADWLKHPLFCWVFRLKRQDN